MKKISTPLISESDKSELSATCAPSKTTLDFIRYFARACRTLPLRGDDGNLSAFVLN